MKCFGDAKDTIDSKQLKNLIYLLRFGHTRALLFKKNDRNGNFPRPRETDPYIYTGLARCLMRQNLARLGNNGGATSLSESQPQQSAKH